METAISLPDTLFEKAEVLAQELELTRSELYAKALAEFVRRQENTSITARINAVCDEVDTSLDPASMRAQSTAILSAEKFWNK